MCTLSFIPEANGYLVGMNRDEQISRSSTLPPERFPIEGGYAVYPRENSGGTWIAANSFGVTLALLNWYSVAAIAPKSQSRGEVIPKLIAGEDSGSVHDALTRLPLGGTLPFRLVGFFPSERAIAEWRWNQHKVEQLEFTWQRHHWFSSGISDAEAERQRGEVFLRSSPNGRSARDWLRTQHRSHKNGPGPFSICVHRNDVRSISYSEIHFSERGLLLEMFSGSPCAQELGGLTPWTP